MSGNVISSYELYYSNFQVWYCWMNSWDDAKASCNAPQEGTAVRSLVPVKSNNASTANASGKESAKSAKVTAYGDSGEYEGDVWREDENDEDNSKVADSGNGNLGNTGQSTGSSQGGGGAGGRRDKNISAAGGSSESGVPALTLQGVSSKGRIVRSRWNTRQTRK